MILTDKKTAVIQILILIIYHIATEHNSGLYYSFHYFLNHIIFEYIFGDLP
jgi:hypothetical protein